MYDKNKKLVDRREMLRIKIKSLMAEARIIRHDEKKTSGQLRNEMHLHRVIDLRRASRNACLAYAIIRGVDPARVEPIRYTEPDWAEVERMVHKYGSVDFRKWTHGEPVVEATDAPVVTQAAPKSVSTVGLLKGLFGKNQAA
jgi:hypothetical protein